MEKRKQFKRFDSFNPFIFYAASRMIYIFINNYIPMAGIIVAFKKYSARKESLEATGAALIILIIFFKSDRN